MSIQLMRLKAKDFTPGGTWVAIIDGKWLLDKDHNVRRFRTRKAALKAAAGGNL